MKVNDLKAEVDKQGKQIEVIEQEVKNVTKKVNKIIEDLSTVETRIEEMSADFGTMVSMMYLQQVLANIEQEVNYVIDCVHTQAEMIRDIMKGSISGKLLPVGALEKTLKDAAYRHEFKPLFTGKNIWHYYGVIKGVLSTSGVIAQIPMATDHRFHLYNIYPFPTFHNGEVQSLKRNNIVFLYSEQHYACLDKHLIDSCVRVLDVSVCVHPRFAVKFLHPPYDCCFELAMNNSDVGVCEFEKSPPFAGPSPPSFLNQSEPC